MQRAIERLHALLLLGFAVVALTLGYWQFFRRDELLARDTNPRLAEEELRNIRGRIVDRNGVVLAETKEEGGGTTRVYPRPNTAHVTGYHSLRYGDTNVEARYDEYLRGLRSADPVDRLVGSLLHRRVVGSDVALTLDARIQQAASDALGDQAGAVVALDPKTGEVLALASNPYFDPGTINRAWEQLTRDPGQPLFNRVSQSAYTPGSTFKLITGAAAVDLGVVDLDAKYRCTTQMDLAGLKVDCRNHAHLASVNYREAFAWSCNRTFALTGLELGQGPLVLGDDLKRPLPWEKDGIGPSVARLEEYATRFGFGREIPFELPVSQSRLKGDGEWYPSLLAQTAFGQGELAATPLVMALATSTIANGGVMPAPYVAAEARAPNGAVSTINRAGSLGRIVKPETAATLNEMMVMSVDAAYAQKAKIPGVKVGGKTGTAETGPAGAPTHSWFIGYAPADNPRVAVAVILENKGSGSDFATPAAQGVLKAALDLYRPEGR
jgi:penicillin-binding protein A